MHVNSATTEEADAGLEDVYRDSVWLVARATSPASVLIYDPRLTDLEEADFFAAQRILWVIERKSVLVATLRCSNDEYDKLFWKQPELIEIAACPGAWRWEHTADPGSERAGVSIDPVLLGCLPESR